MKQFVLGFLMIPALLNAQKDSIINYTEVVTVEGVSSSDLFTRARQWFNETFKSAKDVLQINDKETGELSGKGYLSIVVKYNSMGPRVYTSSCRTAISIWVKDGRYKYSFTDLLVDVADKGTGQLSVLTSSTTCPDKWPMVRQSKMDEIWAAAKDASRIKIEELIASLIDKMKKKSANDF